MDFTNIPPRVCQSLMKLPFNYDKEREARAHARAMYREEKAISEDVFSKWLEGSNAGLLKQINECIEKTFNNHKALFDIGPTIWATSVALGIPPSDKAATLNMIESTFRDKVRAIQFLRILPDLVTKTQLQNFLELNFRTKTSQNLLVIVEQTDKMGVFVLDSLIGFFNNMQNRQRVKNVMVFFCMASSHMSLDTILPSAGVELVGRKGMIIKDISEDAFKRIESLIHGIGNTFKLSAELLDTIYNHTCFVDTSVMYLKYLYQYSMFRHYIYGNGTISNSPKSSNSSPRLSRRKSMRSSEMPSSLAKRGNKIKYNAASGLCESRITDLLDYHTHLTQQLQLYFILLEDETAESFPTTILELYLEVLKYENLSFSHNTIDAIFKLKSYSAEGIIRRIDSMKELNFNKLDHKAQPNVYSILHRFRQKIENNEDSKDIRRDLQENLAHHIQFLKNPLKDPDSASVYFKDRVIFTDRTMPALRYDLSNDTLGSNLFGILYKKICNSPEEISEQDLFYEFLQARKEQASQINLRKSVITPFYKFKSTTRRTGSSLQTKHLPSRDVDSKSETEKKDERELRAVFADLLDCMQHQGIIERELRSSKRGIFKRNVWPPTRSSSGASCQLPSLLIRT